MDIHKPKPFHSVREFLKEYGIIVLGVLTPLALEQVVEALRISREADEIERNLRTEMQTNLLHAAERVALEPCLRQRIEALRNKLDAGGDVWAADPQTYADAKKSTAKQIMPEAFHAPGREWHVSAWQAALSSPALNHFQGKARTDYGRVFNLVGTLRAGQESETTAENDLTALAFNLRMTPELRAHYLDRLGALSREEESMGLVAHQLRAFASAMGIRADPADVRRIVDLQRTFRGACVNDVQP